MFYLNGQEILRSNLPTGSISASTLASSAVNYPQFSGALSVPATAFHVGENTLAVELHQASIGNIDALLGATLTLTETPAPPASAIPLTLNEIASGTAASGTYFVEIKNNGSSTQTLSGMKVVTSGGASYTLGTATLAGGATLELNETTLGFRPIEGEKIFLLTAGSTKVLDGAEAKGKAQARTSAGVWQTPNTSTPGVTNSFSIPNSIVINEIMYNHQPTYQLTGTIADPEEWVELYNRSGSAVDLSGWALHGGADYTFQQPRIWPLAGIWWWLKTNSP